MSEPRDLRSLVGDDVDAAELDRLGRVHELLLEAGPPPELSPTLRSPPSVGRERRSWTFSWFGSPRTAAAVAIAAAGAAAFFGIGYLAGHNSGGGFHARRTVLMHGTSVAPNARASIEVGSADANGNTPMLVHVSGLAKLGGRAYYELYLTRQGRPVLTCGTFNAGTRISFRLTIPYKLKGYDGWVVTRERWKTPHPGPTVLTTFV
jgi:hypothetical protein